MGWERLQARAEAAETELTALYLALRDPRTPIGVKAVLVVLLGYALSPIDPIPDIIPIVGYLDELVLLPIGIAVVRRLIPSHVLEECRTAAEDSITDTPLKWVGVFLTAVFWAAVLTLIGWFIW